MKLKPIAKLSHLPAIDEILKCESLKPVVSNCARKQLVQWARNAVEYYRLKLLDGFSIDAAALLDAVVSHIVEQYSVDQGQTLQRVVNATGILLHTNLGRAPLADKAVERIRASTAFTNLEMDLVSGKRNRRGARVCKLLSELTGAEDAIVVNNCAAATLLALQAIAGGREVIVSRGQLVEIGGGFRLPEVFTAAGVRLHEVGTTNRTYLRDYEAAINEDTGAIIRVHRSNFSQTGFVTEPSIEELVSAKRPKNVPVMDDLGSGCVVDLSSVGIDEPTVQNSISCGADLCLFSGDKLFGGPQSGIIVGGKVWLDQLRASPMMRAMRADKLTLAGLEATAEVHLAGKAFDELPFFRMLQKDPIEIYRQCEAVVEHQEGIPQVKIAVVECTSQIGGGSLPSVELPSFCVSVEVESSENLAAQLRRASPAIQCRQADNRVLLDLRTVHENELSLVANSLRQSLESLNSDDSFRSGENSYPPTGAEASEAETP